MAQEALLVKMSARPPGELCRAAGIVFDGAAAALLAGNPTPGSFLRALIKDGHLIDAVHYLAQGLPHREAVWWACQCVRDAAAVKLDMNATEQVDVLLPGPPGRALAAAETWVYKPEEDRRRTALEAAEAVGMSEPAALAAMAVAWSGGSLAPDGLPEVPPPEHLSGSMVAAAVVVAATRLPPGQMDDALRRYLAKGIEIAMGPQAQRGTG